MAKNKHDKQKKKEKVKKEKRQGSLREAFIKVIYTPLPAPLSRKCNNMSYAGATAIAISLGTLLIENLRFMSPLFAITGLALLGMAFFAKREMVTKGWREEVFQVYDYTYLVPGINRKPTGMVLLKQEEDGHYDDYHVAITNSKMPPPIGWRLSVYVPKDAEVYSMGGRKIFSNVYGYAIIGYEEEDIDE